MKIGIKNNVKIDEKINSKIKYNYKYNSDGQMIQLNDILNGIEKNLEYDFSGRNGKMSDSLGNYWHLTYDEKCEVSNLAYFRYLNYGRKRMVRIR